VARAEGALPEGFAASVRDLLGDELDAFLSALDGEPALALRANPARPFAAAEFAEAPVPWAAGGFYLKSGARPGASVAHRCGAFYVQEASAMMPASVLAVRPGERVLDLCAAPGGKATQLAGALAGEGVLVANEPDAKRARALYGNIERLGVPNAVVMNEFPERLSARWPEAFDAVLVDAPCSGEGMFRREPAARAEWAAGAPAGCARRQTAILGEAAKMVAPGGRLVYSTCTFTETENEGVVRAFLSAHPKFSPCEFALPGLGASRDGMMRVLPHRARGDGQFAALLVKKGIAPAPSEAPAPDKAAREAAARYLEEYPALPAGSAPALWGDTLYAAPCLAPPVDGLKVVSPGLALARVLPGRIEPMHATAMALPGLPSAALSVDVARAFLRGEAVPCEGAGWRVATFDGMPLGWGKASGGLLKNHLPKGLRG
jgi:16S rRNA C967 or C1407 C5-methylase (RsmB/RsmF family)/NOL1/NOP2/fmu family ribosome biogenesis protein